MKICVIGNSHVAALKQGWERVSVQREYSDVSLDFFAAPRDGVKQLKYRDGALSTDDPELKSHMRTSSQGMEKIVVADYDVFVIHGLLSLNKVARTYVSARHRDFSFVGGLIEASLAVKLQRVIEGLGVPVFLSTEPMFSETVLSAETNYGYDAFAKQGLSLTRTGEALVDQWRSCIRDLPVVEQPEDTIVGGMFTRSEYLSKRSDSLHMNQEFGAKMMDKIIGVVRGASEGRSDKAERALGPANPYTGLPSSAYWKVAVANQSPATLSGLYTKRFTLSGKRIATAGSCFAQEIARGLRRNGYAVIDKEPSPNTPEVRGKLEARYGYGLYSARHGNIYTVRQLLQLTKESLGAVEYPSECYVWVRNGRYFDALRPSVEPDGLPTRQEVLLQRRDHVRRFEAVIREADVFIFTMGLTEAWMHKASGLVYPTAPGVLAGEFDPEIYAFHNFTHGEVYGDFVEFRGLVKSVNPGAKFMITVSPVPLTATAADMHVLVATIRSKSILRAVAAQLYEEFDDVDYFPSYELFSTPFLGEPLFKENRRTVTRVGVDSVMRIFFEAHGSQSGEEVGAPKAGAERDAVCEEVLLEAFAPQGAR